MFMLLKLSKSILPVTFLCLLINQFALSQTAINPEPLARYHHTIKLPPLQISPYLNAYSIDRMTGYTKEEPLMLLVSGIMVLAIATILRRKLSRYRRQQLTKVKPTI